MCIRDRITGYSPLGAGSSRVSNVIENTSDKDNTIPAKTIVSQLSLANMIPKLIYPGDDYDNELENLEGKDEGLTFQEFEHHKSIPSNSEQNSNKVEIEDLGEDLESKDDDSWILGLIDLSGLEDWPEHLQIEVKEMMKRNAKTFSKNDLDMGLSLIHI